MSHHSGNGPPTQQASVLTTSFIDKGQLMQKWRRFKIPYVIVALNRLYLNVHKEVFLRTVHFQFDFSKETSFFILFFCEH